MGRVRFRMLDRILECGAAAPLHRVRRTVFGVRRGSAALVRARSSGRDAQENPRRRCEPMPWCDCWFAPRSARQDADRTFIRDTVVCSRTKAVLRTALQNFELRTDPSLTPRRLLECGATAPLHRVRRTVFGVRRGSAALVRARSSGRELKRIREGRGNECHGVIAGSPRGAPGRMRTAPSPGTQWFAHEPKRCFAPHSKTAGDAVFDRRTVPRAFSFSASSAPLR